MYRQYITTGMNKAKRIWFYFFGIAAVVSSRIVYCFAVGGTVADPYEYFANAMIRAGEKKPFFASGLSYAYTEILSILFSFTGNRIEAAGVCQMVLQILWLILFLSGICLLSGRAAGAVSTVILILSPWICRTVFEVSPENFYLFHWSLLLFLLSVYYCKTSLEGWRSGERGRLYLLASGFYAGVLCIWNYMGWALIAAAVFLLLSSRSRASKELISAGENLTEDKVENDSPAEKPLMTAVTQAFSLAEGIAVGFFVTLMKYTGITGFSLPEQFKYWLSSLTDFGPRCQDIRVLLPVHILSAIFTGILFQWILLAVQKKKSAQYTVSEENTESSAEKERMEKEEENIVFTEDGRKIRLLDNPLPGPRKHIKREMDFDLREFDKEKDDFDLPVRDDDDFDL